MEKKSVSDVSLGTEVTINDRRPARVKNYIWCRDVTISVEDGGDYSVVRAAQYICEEDHSDLIVYQPLELQQKSPDKRHFLEIDDLPIVHELSGAIDQPLDADPADDPDTARVYSLIRDEYKPNYVTYKCAHKSVEGQGHGIHLASSAADVEACRMALGILVMKWPK